MLSIEEQQKLRDENPPKVDYVHYSNSYFDWGWKGCGFGQLSFSIDGETGNITCMNEYMGRDSVRKLLHAFADFIADRAILLDNPEDIPPIDAIAERVEVIAAQKKWYEEQVERRAKRRENKAGKFIPHSE